MENCQNHPTLMVIIENHSILRVVKDHENHSRIMRITQESWKNTCWESCELLVENHENCSLRITENCSVIMRIIQKQFVRSYLFNGPQPNDTHTYNIILLIHLAWHMNMELLFNDSCDSYDSMNLDHFPTWSKPQV